MSSECNNIKLAIQNDNSEFVCVMCKQCLITSNHDVCVLNYVNEMNSRVNNFNANVSNTTNKRKHKPKVKKPKMIGSKERLALPKPSKPRSCLRWSPTGRMFDLKGKIIESSKSESRSDSSKDSGCSKHMIGNLKLLINFVWMFLGTVRVGNDHIAAILGKRKKASHPPKPVPNSKQRSKDEAPEKIKTFLKKITVLLQASVIINDHEDIGKLGAKGDIGFFIRYSTTSCAYRVYNRRTKKIIETMNVTFDELSAMAFEQRSSKLGFQSMILDKLV
ncbi:hypothetical protein Tco_0317658 [Tanacetum coccineum]